MNILYIKKITVLFLYLIITSCVLLPCDSQRDQSLEWRFGSDLSEMRKFEDLNERCGLLEECEDERGNILVPAQFEKRNEHDAALTTILNAGQLATIPNNLGPCLCETKPTVLKLGPLHWPRFLPSKVCKPEKCFDGLHRCRPKTFSVRVLKKKQAKDMDQNYLDSTSLPEYLQHYFVEKNVLIIIGCECTL